MTKSESIAHELGGVFWEDYEHVFFAQGKDWWSIGYRPKYPESSAADLDVFGCPSKHRFVLSGNLDSLIPTQFEFNSFGDLCEYLSN